MTVKKLTPEKQQALDECRSLGVTDAQAQLVDKNRLNWVKVLPWLRRLGPVLFELIEDLFAKPPASPKKTSRKKY